MALIERLAGINDPEGQNKLPILTFHACLAELAEGQVTRQQIIDYFNMDAGEIVELDWIIDKYQNAVDKPKFVELVRTLFILAESDMPGYTTNADLVARIEAG